MTDQLRLLAAALEIPECGCPSTLRKLCDCEHECDCPRAPGPPCAHLLARTHDLSVRKWAALLALAFPGDYDDPPPASPCLALSRQARVAVYAERARSGLGLFHPEDLAQARDDGLKVGVASTREGPPREGGRGEADAVAAYLSFEEAAARKTERRLRNGRVNPNDQLRRAG